MLERVKAAAKSAFHHRTKLAGGLGIVAGGAEHWLSAHDKLPALLMSYRGGLLMFFGGLVGAIGIYNSLANYFGWTDDP
jgi:hypothetical protein